MNTNIIASNCPNGPQEIICDKDFLFNNDSVDDLLNKFEIFRGKSDADLRNQRINIKRKIKFYTSFQHYKKLDLILNEKN